MWKTDRWVLAGMAVLFLSTSGAAGETWRLDRDQTWKPLQAGDKHSLYILEVARFKKLIHEGKPAEAKKTLAGLKTQFAELLGPDFDAFIDAEMLLAGGKLKKALKKYDEFLAKYPDSEFFEPVLERQYSIAAAYLGGQKRSVLKVFKVRDYSAGVRIMEKIADKAGDAPIAKRAMVAIAKSYERRGKFTEAYATWSDIRSRWPMGDISRQALLGMAESMHAAYRGPKYEAGSLESAKSYYTMYKKIYPDDAEKIGVDARLKQIKEQQAYKDFIIGQYYDRTASRQAANLYYNMVLKDWPDSTAAKRIHRIRTKKQSGREKK